MSQPLLNPSDITWRHLSPRLWVAVGPLGHMGTIEQGHRFAVIDTRGEVRGRCRTLEDAMSLLAAVGDHTAHDWTSAA